MYNIDLNEGYYINRIASRIKWLNNSPTDHSPTYIDMINYKIYNAGVSIGKTLSEGIESANPEDMNG